MALGKAHPSRQNVFHDQKVRQTFSDLTFIAEHRNCAFLIVRHLTKGGSENPLYRGGGSIGIIAMARTGLLVAQHPSDENKRLLVTVKNNLSEKACNLTYQVIPNEHGIPSIQWLGTNHYPVASLLRASTPLSLERQEILKVLQAMSRPLSPKEVAEQTGQDHTLVRQLLRRMLNAGDIISPAYGLYTAHHYPSPETVFSQNNAATPATLAGDLNKGTALAFVLVPGAFVSLFANPLFGWLSDQTHGRPAV